MESLYEEKAALVGVHEIHVVFMDGLKQVDVNTGNIAETIPKTSGGGEYIDLDNKRRPFSIHCSWIIWTAGFDINT